TLGLHIKGIEEDSLAKKENLFQEDECIVQINNVPLQDKTFAQSQDVFRQAMATPSVQLEILSVANRTRYEKGLIGQLFTGDGKDLSAKTKSPMLVRAKANPQPEPKGDKLSTKLEERVSPTALAPQTRPTSTSPTPKVRSQSPLVAKSPVIPGLPNLTSKKGGKRIKIDLKKGAEGLGFTVVTRDSSVHEPGPILVKNILQRGAAVKDGRLQPGDRILEVNGVDMTGRSQEELVAMLRSTKQGESVSVVVARQEDLFLPRELNPNPFIFHTMRSEKGEDAGSLVLEDGREQLMYEIPLNETGSAGLGVSLKGNKSRETGEDLGIFIKSIIHGGAAYKDGRLSVNDQLIAINGESLLGRSNHAAMETLRRSMSSEGNSRGTIQLVVLRAPHQVDELQSTHAEAGRD
uniref:PDZ domain-containing protein n=1 Tax=Tetraodon nigroviridis TaxID=99883 RepID=H3C3X1_TETNG